MTSGQQPAHAATSFAATRWTLVLAAGETADQRHADALAELCQAYWYPIYAYVRHCGYPNEAAEPYAGVLRTTHRTF